MFRDYLIASCELHGELAIFGLLHSATAAGCTSLYWVPVSARRSSLKCGLNANDLTFDPPVVVKRPLIRWPMILERGVHLSWGTSTPGNNSGKWSRQQTFDLRWTLAIRQLTKQWRILQTPNACAIKCDSTASFTGWEADERPRSVVQSGISKDNVMMSE